MTPKDGPQPRCHYTMVTIKPQLIISYLFYNDSNEMKSPVLMKNGFAGSQFPTQRPSL